MKTYIELPSDKFGNIGFYYRGSRVVIQAIQEDEHTLRVLWPDDFAWPEVHPAYFMEVEHAPGPVTFEEWARLVGYVRQ